MYLEAGALSDALDFYAKAEHLAGMQKIKDIALAGGDVFFFRARQGRWALSFETPIGKTSPKRPWSLENTLLQNKLLKKRAIPD